MCDLPKLRILHLRLTYTTHLTYPSPVNIELTLRSGQLLSWEQTNDQREAILFHKGSVLRLKPISHTIVELQVRGDAIKADVLKRIMGVNGHGNRIGDHTRRDPFLATLWESYRGLTFLKQDPYECLISFMSSGMSTMVRTRRTLAALRRELGIPIGDTGYCALPGAERIDDLKNPEGKLRELGFGYRAAFLARTCRILAQEGTDLEDLDGKKDDELRSWLRSLPGVGQKIAECVLLFGFGRTGAFPVDVWVKRALESQWPSGVRRSPEAWNEWARDKWGVGAGYVQQLLFMWARGERALRVTRNA